MKFQKMILFFLFLFSSILFAKINVDVKVGFDKKYIVNKTVPVIVSISSYNEDFSGYIVVDAINYRTEKKYKKTNIKLFGNQNTKKIYFYINFDYNLNIRVYNDDNEICYEAVTNLNNALTETYKTLHLSRVYANSNFNVLYIDNKKSSLVLDDFQINKTSQIKKKVTKKKRRRRYNRYNRQYQNRSKTLNFKFNVFSLKPENLLNHISGYDMFNCIVLNNISQLEVKKYFSQSKILDWVRSGGSFLIFAKSNYESLNDIIPDRQNIIKFQGFETLDYSNLFNKYNSNLKKHNIESAVFKLNNLKYIKNSIFDNQNNLLYTLIPYGLGQIGILSAEKSNDEITKFLQKNSFFWLDLLGLKTLKTNYISAAVYTRYASNSNQNQSRTLFRLLNSHYGLKYPGVIKIMLYLILFILIVNIINYKVLKKLNKELYLLISIPVISLIFTFTSYLWYRVYTEKVIYKYDFTINAFNSGDQKKYVYNFLNFLSPQKEKYDISTKPNFSLNTILYNRYREKTITEQIQNDNFVYKNYFLTSKKPAGFYSRGVLPVEGTLRGKIKVHKNNYIDYDINNMMPYDIEDAFIIYLNKYYYIGDIKSGANLSKTDLKLSRIRIKTSSLSNKLNSIENMKYKQRIDFLSYFFDYRNIKNPYSNYHRVYFNFKSFYKTFFHNENNKPMLFGFVNDKSNKIIEIKNNDLKKYIIKDDLYMIYLNEEKNNGVK